MHSPVRKILVGGLIFLATFAVAITGYWSAGWSLLDAIYMVTITISGVGYGEVRPIDAPPLRVFTIFVILAGCSSGVYVLGGFVQMVAEGEINRALGARRMTRGISLLSGHAIICGFGRVGQILATELAERKHPFVVIDASHERIRLAEDRGYLVLSGDASEESVLLAARARQAAVIATVLPDDAANVFITLTAREINETASIIARAEKPATESKLLRSGATKVILPAAIGATKIAQLILRPTAEELLEQHTATGGFGADLSDVGLGFHEHAVSLESPLHQQKVGDLELKNQHGVVLLAIRRADGRVEHAPAAETILNAGDTLLLLAHHNDDPQATVRHSRDGMMYRGVRVSH